MRPIDSCYDRNTAGTRDVDPGDAMYALVRDVWGPCSRIVHCVSLEEAIEEARAVDLDDPFFDLEDELDLCFEHNTAGSIEAAEKRGWRVVATAPAGEDWTVLVETERWTP